MKLTQLITVAVAAAATACTTSLTPDMRSELLPPVMPDYHGTTIPLNIAPLNLAANNEGSTIQATAALRNGEHAITSVRTDETRFDTDQWHTLLSHAAGDSIYITVTLRTNGETTQYRPIAIAVSPDSIDYGLAYRLIAPGYQTYSFMGIYQRELATFEQKAIIENTLTESMCINCHSFNNRSTSKMSLHFRGAKGCTAITDGSRIELLNTKTDATQGNCVYPYWHPDGQHIAYSVNMTKQAYHISDPKRIEVIDHWSDIVVCNTADNTLHSCPQLKSASSYETFPAFSPDGQSLYFCTAKALPEGDNDMRHIRYSLCRISFNSNGCAFGATVDTLVNAPAMGKSVSFPRPSPCGRFVAYTLSDYGQFSIWHPEADIWIYDTLTQQSFPLAEANSPNVDSYHSWSSNGRWMVISSRRDNGLFTQPYIAHIDNEGHASKAFRLPLESPCEYDLMFLSFNIPEFITEPVSIDHLRLADKLHAAEHTPLTYCE